MKKLSLLAVVAGLTALAAPAFAHDNESGVACRNFNAGEVTDIDYLTSGVRNISSASRSVICPVDFVPTSDGSITVYVDGRNSNTTVSTSCTLNSYDWNNTYLGSVSDTKTGVSGAWEMALVLPAGQASVWSYLTVLCSLPASSAGTITGITAMP